MAKDGATPKAEPEPTVFTEEDLRLGMRAVRYNRRLAWCAVVFCLVCDVITFAFFLPLGAIAPGETRRGGHYALWMVMVVCLAWIVMVGQVGRKPKPDDHHMKQGSRGVVYVLGTVLVLFPVWAQTVTILQTMEVYGALSR